MPNQQFQSCIDACYACAAACDHCAAACLQEQDVKMMARCIALDMDCAEICRMAAAYMARGSELASALCRVCADVCEACGDECAQHQMGHCQECAQACRRCADECRRMAGGAGAQQQDMATGATAH
ncbi:four-helix bundle copper-binding protein [Noviherbaspirillum sp. CPCC 100848]|uniref:Four-helix bundle copper-binding protein n=1 Tax=Noviherbaspirillum album TaxID=3080276 RepID=A0ABU6JJ21_9BURK|nr:four-helix bundle copper-binding protein [Noviherbaspirillum sp. CPCC 100848]